LTAISGETADFLVGGEFPVPVGRSDNQITIEFKKYGIGLSFTPVVMSGGRISLRVKTEVSELTNDGALQLQGGGDSGSSLTLPGLRVRRAETTVELPSGGSIVMAGLIKDDIRKALSGWPGLMKLPVLGALFKSHDYQRAQTELAIFVTPILVDPMATSSITRPDKNFAPASDAAGIFLNRINRMYRLNNGKGSGTYYGSYGFIYE
jgi:pilus assembly protein CpaC